MMKYDMPCFPSLKSAIPEMNKLFGDIPCDTTFDENQMHSVVTYSIKKTFMKDQLIFIKGEPGDSIFIILSGKVRIINHSSDGKEVILAILGRNDIFGEMALLDGKVRCATVIAHTFTETLALNQFHFRELITKEPSFFIKILRLFIARIRSSNAQIELLALRSVKERIASLLVSWAEEEGYENSFKLPYTHQHIAAILGTSRECITRTLKELTEENHITIKRNTILIKDLNQLKKLSE